MHSKKTTVTRCHNKEIKAELLEARVWAMIGAVMLDPVKLRATMDLLTQDTGTAELRHERELRRVDERLQGLGDEKRRIIDVYASGNLARTAYIEKNRAYDAELDELRGKRGQLVRRMPLLHRRKAVDTSIARYCETARLRYHECTDFSAKRQFLLDHVEKVTFSNDRVTLHGSVPIELKAMPAEIGRVAETENGTIAFCIEDRITAAEKLANQRRCSKVYLRWNRFVSEDRD